MPKCGYCNKKYVKSIRKQGKIKSPEKALINWKKTVIIFVSLVLVFAIAGSALLYFEYQKRRFPDVVNMGVEEARNLLEKREMAYEIKYDFESSLKENMVSKQSVEAGQVYNQEKNNYYRIQKIYRNTEIPDKSKKLLSGRVFCAIVERLKNKHVRLFRMMVPAFCRFQRR